MTQFFGKYRGVVSDNVDPLMIGRVRARAPEEPATTAQRATGSRGNEYCEAAAASSVWRRIRLPRSSGSL